MLRNYVYLLILFFFSYSYAQKNYADQWVATDALNRKLPEYKQVGPKKEHKYVGLFYYIWHGYHSTQIWDNTTILKKSPTNPKFGTHRKFHFWGEPEYGYYNSNDPWVIRNDLQMFSNAGIDFIFFDVTNNFTYLTTVKKICKISLELREQGLHTPKICFLTNSKSGRVMNELYDKFYSKKLYKELWFYWQGKPLIMGQIKDPVLRKEVKEFFTIKYSWAWTKTTTNPNHWQWVDDYPQDYGWSESPNLPEQITVATASHPTRSKGKSYHNYHQPKVNAIYETEFTDHGLYFAEQWKRALEVNPKVVMITQWNEWIAQRFISDKKLPKYAGKPLAKGSSIFVDAFNKEFNRDIAPMKDGYTDNYYYQMVANIRKFKGLNPPNAYSPNKAIKIDGNFNDWKNVEPTYHDAIGDVMHRNFKAYNPIIKYKNKTGRNDIIASKVTNKEEYVYFYCKTHRKLSKHNSKNWMLLYIDIDKEKNTGWEGYDFLINKEVTSKNSTSLHKWVHNKWTKIATIPIKYKKNELEIAVPVSLIQKTNFYFHWADNPPNIMDFKSFFLNGDSAPDRRFNYNYK